MDTTYSRGERPFTPTYGGSNENLRKSYIKTEEVKNSDDSYWIT